jgi:hypothetical protein
VSYFLIYFLLFDFITEIIPLANLYQQKNRPIGRFLVPNSEFGIFFAFLCPAFTATRAFIAAFAAVVANGFVASAAILLVFQWHAAFAALVGFCLVHRIYYYYYLLPLALFAPFSFVPPSNRCLQP